MSEDQIIDNLENLLLEVYTIGYPDQGESQIILLKENTSNRIFFSCVIDCFADKINQTVEILKENQVSSLNYFIWTHTDEDHSIGIDDIINNFDSNVTKYIFPEGIYGNENDLIDYNQKIKCVFDKINSLNKGSNYKINTATVSIGGNSSIFSKKYKDYRAEIKFEIIAIAPISAICRRRFDSGKINKKNDFSIATLFKIGELSLLFSGDIENQTINLIPDSYFKNLSYLKTPHHSSNSSNNLISKINSNFRGEKIPTAVSTTYKRNNLPDPEVINEYKKYVSFFYSTGIDNKSSFGYVKTIFNVVNNEIIFEECVGNAHIC